METKTAAFQTGMADAAKTARKSFKDIEHGAAGMSESTRMSMTDAREGVMLLGEQFGVRLPRALTTFIAELGPVAGAIEAAFPFIAVAALAGILIEHLTKLHEAGLKLTEDQMKFGTAAQNAFNDLDKKLLQAGITADDLSNNHLDAVHKKLQLIDMQSMEELNRTFGILQKTADAVFKNLESHWYTLGSGSEGAKNALDQFQVQYASMLAHGKNKDASDLLGGTLNSAKESLAKMEAAQDASEKMLANTNIIQKLNPMMLGLKEQEIARKDALASQRQLVQSLEDQVTVQGKVNNVSTQEKKNVVHADHNEQAAKRAAAAKEGISTRQAIAEQQLAAEKSEADASLTIHHASVEARLAVDLEFAGKDHALKEAANQQEIAALNKSGKEYNTQLKALQDNALKITADYNAKVVELKSRASVSEYNRDIQVMEQGESDKIGAVKEGTAARLAVIDAALKEEESKNLQATQHFVELTKQRAQEVLKEADLEAKAKAEAASVQAKADAAAASEKARHTNTTAAIKSGGGNDNIKQLALEKMQQQESYNDKKAALQKELELYKQAGEARKNQAQDVQNQLIQLEQTNADKMVELGQRESMANRQTYVSMAQTASSSLMQVALGHQSLAATVQKFAQEGLEHVLAAIFEEMVGQKSLQMARAESAAAGAYTSLSSVPLVGPVLAGVAAATVFAGAMAFESGGIVPGVGKGDVVPAMLTPGEGIVPGSVMDGLRNMARNGGMNGSGTTNHYHSNPTYHLSVLDGDGMKTVLEKNEDVVHSHITNSLRKMNK